MWTRSLGKQRASQWKTLGHWCSFRGELWWKEADWLEVVFLLEDCNCNPENQVMSMGSPLLSDRGGGGENENQIYYPPLKEERRKCEASLSFYFLVLDMKINKRWIITFCTSPWAAAVVSSWFVSFRLLIFLTLLSICLPFPPSSLTVFQAIQGNYNSKWKNGDQCHVTGSSEMKWAMEKAYVW